MKSLIIGIGIAAIAAAASIWWTRKAQAPMPATTMEELLKLPGGQETIAAGECLVTLLDQGKLPGVAIGEHGTLIADDQIKNLKRIEEYPAILGFRYESETEGLIHHYNVVLTTKNGTWHLDRAWDTDRTGQLVHEYAFKAEAKP